MTPLERALRERIKIEGPITVEAYMEACNTYYYATRDPLGECGDFTTAPEISQMFGEIVGAVLADSWKRAGLPADAILVELGPGRGTLASDALRVLRSAEFSSEVHLVESSPVLRAVQRTVVPEAHWHESVADLPTKPFLLVANEFLDALPVRQHVGSVERRVVMAAGGLAFDRDGEIVETSPAREKTVASIAGRVADYGGISLFIDYGHERSAPGDTLQAVRGHRFAPVLANPGEQDLTAHVDFEVIAHSARSAGVAVTSIVALGEWLRRVGIEARAENLARSNPDHADEVRRALDRLTASDQMGDLFKVMAVHSPDWPVPAGWC